MPKIIFTSRYIKGGKRGGNLVSYIATRDGVALPTVINGTRPATENQRRLIEQVVLTVPELTGLFEYEDYAAAPSVANASALITTAFEQNPELWSSVKKYVEYIARRPGAERSVVSGHGLWNDGDDKIVLARAVDEIANHKGNIWTHVVSLRRDDAERTGYVSAESWRSLVTEQLPTIADAMKIPMEHLRWYAAYHDKDTNPHIHLLVYSENPQEGYLTEPGIEKMRSSFAHGIYKDEFMHIYERKDHTRGELNRYADERIKNIAESIDNDSPELTQMLLSLGEQLRQSKGKKQYGYLKPAQKQQVDEIVRQLAADPRIEEMYRHWCELSADVKRIYTSKIDAPLPLEHEKTFKTIKNAVVRQAIAAVELSRIPDAPEHDTMPEEPAPDAFSDETDMADDVSEIHESRGDYHVSWSQDYIKARKYLFGQGVEKDFSAAHRLLMREARQNNALALYDVGYTYQHGLGNGIDADMEMAQKWYGYAYTAFCTVEAESHKPYLRYRIGKMHRDGLGTLQDYAQAAAFFKMAADDGYQYAQYSLGSLYRRGLGVEQNDAEAMRLFTQSADQGNAYAAYELAGMYEKGVATVTNTITAQKYYKAAFNRFLFMEAKGADDKLQYRIGKMLLEGKGTVQDIHRAAEYFAKSAENKNTNAQYALARLILDGSVPGEFDTAVKWMQKSAEAGNEFAQYALGKLYLTDKHKNMAQAIHWLTATADQGNVFAKYKLGIVYLSVESINIPLALQYLKDAAEQNNQYAQYQLGKLYLKGDDAPQDREKAVEYFTLSAVQGNEHAQWFLDHMNDYHGPGAGTLLRLLAQMLQQDYAKQQQRYEQAVDRKLMAKIRRKKQELGQRFE